MKLTLPASPIRRLDVAVGSLIGLWVLSGLLVVSWLAVTHPIRPGTSLFPFIAICGLLLLAASNACVGTVLGRAWGFRWMTGVTTALVLGMLTQTLILKRSFAISQLIENALVIAVLVYSVFRLRSLRREARRASQENAP